MLFLHPFSAVLLLSVVSLLVVAAPTNSKAEEAEEQQQDDSLIDLTALGPTIYGQPSGYTGYKLVRWFANRGAGNAEEQGTYHEGDILFPSTMLRNGLRAESKRWEDGVVPVEVDSTFTREDVAQIKNAMREYHTHTCIKFVERLPSDKDYLFIQNQRTGCWSSVGRVGGRQELNLQSGGCTAKIGTVMHEMMHALGFLHEHTREDRDSYVQVRWENIKSGSESDFQIVKGTTTYGLDYDYGSLLHYSPVAFSKNGQKTLVPKQSSGEAQMGQRDHFSVKDLRQINTMYKCETAKKDQSLTWLDKLINMWGVVLQVDDE